jgi:hypothetical protein
VKTKINDTELSTNLSMVIWMALETYAYDLRKRLDSDNEIIRNLAKSTLRKIKEIQELMLPLTTAIEGRTEDESETN